MWREEESLWDVMFPLHQGKHEEDKSLKRMSDKFLIFLIFLNKVLFRIRNIFSAYPGDSYIAAFSIISP